MWRCSTTAMWCPTICLSRKFLQPILARTRSSRRVRSHCEISPVVFVAWTTCGSWNDTCCKYAYYNIISVTLVYNEQFTIFILFHPQIPSLNSGWEKTKATVIQTWALDWCPNHRDLQEIGQAVFRTNFCQAINFSITSSGRFSYVRCAPTSAHILLCLQRYTLR